MSAADLLRRLDDLGVRLTLAGGRIRYHAKDETLSTELLAEMKEHRDELVGLLTHRTGLRWPPARVPSVGGERRGPLTRAQRELWATTHFVADGTYNVCGALRLRGTLDRDAFAGALADVSGRHSSLRTVFTDFDGVPSQCVVPRGAAPVTTEDLSAERDPLAVCLRACADAADRVLPVDSASPVRMTLYRLAVDDHVFFTNLHHIIADGVSVTVLLDDLARCYNARLAGVPVDPPGSELDMVDYACWERDHLAYADLAAARRYQQEVLSGAHLGALPLPPPLEPATASRARMVTAVVDAATTAAIRALASASRSSPFAVVTAAIAVMLHRYTGRDAFLVGMPVTRRDRPGLADMVGLLLDTVPVRMSVVGDGSFADLVRGTRSAVLGALTHADAAIALGTDPARAARTFFNVVIADAGAKLDPPPFTGLAVEELTVDRVGSKFDLNFLVRDDGSTIAIDVEFEPTAVSESDLVTMLDLAQRVVTQGTCEPGRRLSDLAVEPAGVAPDGAMGERPERVPHDGDSLPGRFAQMAAAQPDAIAVSCAGTDLTYAELASRVDRTARGLARRGVRPGAVVAVSLPRGIDLVVAIIGVMAAGAAVVVLHESWPAERRHRILTDSGAVETIDSRESLDEVAEAGGSGADRVAVPADAVAYVIYTSGSTGLPKGVHVTHRNLLTLVDGMAGPFGHGPSDVWTLFHACSFDVSMYEMFGCLLLGGRLVVVTADVAREPEEFALLLHRERVTVLSQTPSALSVMLPAIATSPDITEHLRYVLLAGEALDRRLVDRWHELLGDRTWLVNLYGTTETTVHSSWAWLRPGDTSVAESDVGVPLPGGSLHVLHANGRAVSDRCVGEICIGGPQVSLGYLSRPRECALRFVPDPFSAIPGARLYRSGDLGRRNGKRIASLGRRDTQVKISGFRIELAEVEAALVRLAGVAAAAAAVYQGGADPTIVAVIVAERGPVSVPGILRGLRAVLPTYMLPRTVAVVDALPLTVNGKIDRLAVGAAAERVTGAAPDPEAAVPRAGNERLLLDLYGTVLDRDSVSTATDFFDAGGDSMRAIRLVGAARARGMVFTVHDVYAAPVLSDLAARAATGEVGTSARPPFSLLPPGAADGFPSDVVDAYPMTALQTGMMYHQEIAPGSSSYHIVLSYQVRGPMVPDAFRAAAQAVTDAHPILRTSFDLNHLSMPVQRVHAGVDAPVSFTDLRTLSRDEAARRVRQATETEQSTGFDLAQSPMWRLLVLILSDTEYRAIFTHHHAILDGWSVNMFFGDLHAQYQARLDGGPVPDMPDLRTSFADYVALELRAVEDPNAAAFWADRVQPDAALVAPDRTGEPVMGQVHLELPDLIGDLRRVASALDVSVKSLMLAAHVRVVSWLTGSDDPVATSSVIACRPEEPDSDRLLGLFLNQLPLQVKLAAQSWRELASELRRQELETMPHRWYPYAAIQRPHGARPLFDTSFNFTDYHTTRQLVRGQGLEVLDSDELESTHYAFGCNYTVDVHTGELRLILEYDGAALARPLVVLAGEAHRRILSAMIADPEAGFRATVLPGAADLARVGTGEPAGAGGQAAEISAVVSTRRGQAEPPAELVASVAQVWAEVLGPGSYPPDRGFFDAGGSSLSAMRVVNSLRARYGSLSMREFMAAQTVAGVARVLAGSSDSAAGLPSPSSAADRPRRFALTAAQRQIWQVERRIPGVAMFGIPGAVRVDGPLDLDRLAAVLNALAKRHEALRTRVEVVDDEPVLVVDDRVTVELPVVDLRADADPVAQCEAWMAAEVRRPVPLDRAPLLRGIAFRLQDDQHVLYLNLHHIVSDGWSLSLLLRETVDAYGRPDADLPLAAGHEDLLRVRSQWLRSAGPAQQLAYWTDRLAPPWRTLAGGPSSRFAELRPATFIDRLRSASVRRRLDPDSAKTLHEAAAKHGLTEFMVILAGYATALSRWSGLDDIRIATQLANRVQPGTEDIVGLLVNTAVLRMSILPGADPVEVARQAGQVCLDAYDRQELPFEEVLAALTGDGTGPTEPAFEAMLVMQEETPVLSPQDGLTFRAYHSGSAPLGSPIAPSTADFVLGITPDAGGLVLTLLYKLATTSQEFARTLLDEVAATIGSSAAALRGRP